MNEECQCAQVEGGSILVCPMHYNAMQENSYLNFKTASPVNSTDVIMIGTVPCFRTDSHDARDHPCLEDGGFHTFYECGIYEKCSKCGMSYEKPASKDFVI